MEYNVAYHWIFKKQLPRNFSYVNPWWVWFQITSESESTHSLCFFSLVFIFTKIMSAYGVRNEIVPHHLLWKQEYVYSCIAATASSPQETIFNFFTNSFHIYIHTSKWTRSCCYLDFSFRCYLLASHYANQDLAYFPSWTRYIHNSYASVHPTVITMVG